MAETFCTNCGQELQADALFCPECGQPVAREDAAKPAAAKQGLPALPDLRNLNLPENWWVWALGALLVIVGITAMITRDSGGPEAEAEAEVEELAATKSRPRAGVRSVPPSVPKAAQTPPTGRWEAEIEVSPLDDSRTLYLDLDANTAIWGPNGRSFTPRLTVACKGEEYQAYVFMGMRAETERRRDLVTARLRFDDLEAETVSMIRSQEDDALFFREPREIVGRLRNHDRLVFGFTPADSDIALTSFNLRGLTKAMGPLEEQCGWEEEEAEEEQTPE